MRLLLTVACLGTLPLSLGPQTAPTPSEIAGFSPQFAAAHGGSAGDVRAALADGASVSETDSKNRLATHVAGLASNEAALIALAEAGAPLDHLNNLGLTALMEAVVLGDGGADHVETASLLVQARTDQNIADREGVTPLEHAQRRGYLQMVEVLRNGTKTPPPAD